MPHAIRILYVTESAQDFQRTRDLLAETLPDGCQMEQLASDADAMDVMRRNQHSVYLVDYDLKARDGIEVLREAIARGCTGPAIILTAKTDRVIDLQAMEAGAADYLEKDKIDGTRLERSIRYAIEHNRLLTELRVFSLVDPLTGLYNRRGFHMLSEEQLKVAKRWHREMTLIFVDIDAMKYINDTWGHPEGDLALIGTAKILKSTFREADIVARIGGDEFAVLALETFAESTESLNRRLKSSLDQYNAASPHRHTLSLCIGRAHYKPENPCTIDGLIKLADSKMYKYKGRKAPLSNTQNPSQATDPSAATR